MQITGGRQAPQQSYHAPDDHRHAEPMQPLVRGVAVAGAVLVQPGIDAAHGTHPTADIAPRGYQVAISLLSLSIAFASTWRTRSAEIPYSSASSCRVALSSVIQRRFRMSRLR